MLHDEKLNPTEIELEIPEFLLCPITAQIFLHPVTLFPSGIVVEQQAADKIIQGNPNNPLCPFSRKKIEGYTSAYKIEEIINTFLQKNPEAKKQQYVPGEPFKKCLEWKIGNNPITPVPNNEIKPLFISFSTINTDRNVFFDIFFPGLENKISQNGTVFFEAPNDTHSFPLDLDLIDEIPNEEYISLVQEDKKQIAPMVLPLEDKKAAPIPPSPTLSEIKAEDLRKNLIARLQDLIWALKFEPGPEPQSSMQNLFVAPPTPLPWKKIKIAEGPKNETMHAVLRAAIEALKKLNPKILEDCKRTFAELYDEVKPLLGKTRSLGTSHYAKFAKSIGTISNQPGHLVSNLVREVENLLPVLCPASSYMNLS